ncbi:MAG: hypothetical protein WC679_11835 [Bacteroidales bacterium]|jgi:hypothetical protein
MKKIVLFLALMATTTTLLNAQETSAGTWKYGPMIGMGAVSNPKDEFQLYGSAGLFAQYAFTDIINLDVETKYEYRFGISSDAWHYLDIPAIVFFRIGNGYIGAGAQYSQCLSSIDDFVKVSGQSTSYLSGLLEFSYISHTSMNGNWVTYSEKGFRSIIRIGYAVTPLSFSKLDEYGGISSYKGNPFFFEAVMRFDISKYFNKQKSNRRRR